MNKDFDNGGFPVRGGIYLVKVPDDKDPRNINVYEHPIKGLSCFSEDFGSAGMEVNDETDCHVSVQCTGLEFIKRIGGL